MATSEEDPMTLHQEHTHGVVQVLMHTMIPALAQVQTHADAAWIKMQAAKECPNDSVARRKRIAELCADDEIITDYMQKKRAVLSKQQQQTILQQQPLQAYSGCLVAFWFKPSFWPLQGQDALVAIPVRKNNRS